MYLGNLINKLKKVFKSTNNNSKPFVHQTEEEYYEELFTKHPKWSSPNPNHEEQLRWEIIKNFVEIAKGNSPSKNFKILDLGSGRGWLTNLLSTYGEILGIEPVKPVVEYARKIFPNIEFLSGTTKDLLDDEKKNQFDLIVSSEVFEHIPDEGKDEFITDIYKLLSPNGFLILTTPRQEAQEQWMKYGNPNQPIEDWISESELKRIVEKNKFEQVKLERFSISPNEQAPKIEIYQLWLFKKLG